MIRWSARVTFRLAGILIAGAAVLIALFAWRLASGPIAVAFLTPYLQDALADGPVDVQIGATVLRWGGFDQPLQLTATEVTLFDERGAAVATVPELSVSLSLRDLLRQREVRPSRLELVRPQVTLTREANGRFAVDLGGDPALADGALASLLAALAGDPAEADHPTSALTEFVIRDGRLTIDDKRAGLSWVAPTANIALERRGATIIGHMGVVVALEGRQAQLDADLSYDPRTGQTSAVVSFSGIVPAGLAPIDPLLAPLAAVASPVSGTANFGLDAEFQPTTASFRLEAGAGQIQIPRLYPEPVTVAALRVAGHIDAAAQSLIIDEYLVDLGGPRATGSIEVIRDGADIDIVAYGHIEELPTDLLDSFWPADVALGARRWVTRNLKHGIVRSGDLVLQARSPGGRLGEAQLVSLDGGLAFEGLTVNYLPGLPEVTGVYGTADFDRTTFSIDLHGGQAGALAVPEAKIVISDIGPHPHPIDIEVVVSGPVREAVEVLSLPRLNLAQRMGLEPERVGGEMAARLRFAFMLRRQIRFNDVALSTAANLRNAHVTNLLDGVTIAGIDGRMNLDGQGLALTGTGAANGAPVSFEWRELFSDDAGYRTRVAFNGTLDRELRDALGLPADDGLTGPIGVDAVYTDADRRSRSIQAELDLRQAEIVIPALDWAKPAGVPGRANLTLALEGGRATAIRDFDFEGAGLWAAGDMTLAGSSVSEARFDRLSFDGTEVTATLTRQDAGGFAIAVSGPRLDASRLIDRATGGGSGTADSAPMAISFDVGELALGDGRRLNAARGQIATAGGSITGVDLTAQTPEGVPVRLVYQPQALGGPFQITTADAGSLLRALDLIDTVQGGQLTIAGGRQSPEAPITGQIWLDGYRLVRAPALARLLAAMSFGGLQDVLSGPGLDFNRLRGGFSLAGDRLTLTDLTTSGGALGLTLEGGIDLAGSTIDARGTIVPLVGINRLIDSIPVLGDLLVGGEGEGVFAFTYRVSGALGSPQIGVNPLSALAPGFLRTLFFGGGFGSGGADDPTPAQLGQRPDNE